MITYWTRYEIDEGKITASKIYRSKSSIHNVVRGNTTYVLIYEDEDTVVYVRRSYYTKKASYLLFERVEEDDDNPMMNSLKGKSLEKWTAKHNNKVKKEALGI